MINLYNMRQKRGLSRYELANIVGVNARDIRDYEMFRDEPSEEILFKIADALDVDAATLVTGKKDLINTNATVNLAKIRTEKGISQDALSDMVGLGHTAIYRYEKLISIPKIHVLQEIAAALNVDVDSITGRKPDADNITKNTIEGGNEKPMETARLMEESEISQEMETPQELERMLNEDSREKKRYCHVPIGTKKNGVILYADTLTGKKKTEYTKPSEVIVSNIEEAIVPLAKFKTFNEEKQKTVLKYWFEKYSRKAVEEVWGSRSLIKYYARVLGVSKMRQSVVKAVMEASPVISDAPVIPDIPQKIVYPTQFDSVFRFYLDDQLSGEDAYNALKMVFKIVNVQNDYEVTLSIKEINK